MSAIFGLVCLPRLGTLQALSLILISGIPDDVYENWNTQPIVAGSDSEHNCDSDVELRSETESVGNNTDHNPKLH
jgi:hypothetical protein